MPKTQQVIVAMIEHRPTCKDCGENLEGDGYTSVIHCPYTEELGYDLEPDANPVYCGWRVCDDK